MLRVIKFMGFRSRRCVVQIARALLLSLFFSQVALAASGCMMPSSELFNGLSQTQHSCCDQPEMNANLCVVHCTADSQAHDHHSFTAPVVPLAAGPFTRVPSVERPPTVAIRQSILLRATVPPISILFCSFLI
jgi:hypothetical protein